MLQPLAQIQEQRIISFLLYLNNFHGRKETLQQNQTVLCRAALWGGGGGVSHSFLFLNAFN
jgi:hypothetical protein